MRRCPIMSGASPLCFSASVRNCAAKVTHDVAIECHVALRPRSHRVPKTKKWVFGRLSERFSLFDQQACPLRSRLGFRRSISFDMDEWGYERDLKFDLLAAQRGCAG